jgi:hypothetical protein
VGKFDAHPVQGVFAVKAVLHRCITTNTTTGKHGYETVNLTDYALSLNVVGEIVLVQMLGGQDHVAAVRLGEKDYITFEQEAAAQT